MFRWNKVCPLRFDGPTQQLLNNVYVFIKLCITAQLGPAILIFQCYRYGSRCGVVITLTDRAPNLTKNHPKIAFADPVRCLLDRSGKEGRERIEKTAPE